MDEPIPPLSPPPNLNAPPPPNTPPRFNPQQPPRKGRGWMVVVIIILVIALMMSLLANLAHLTDALVSAGITHERTAGPKLEEVVLEDNDSKNKICVINVDGVIAEGYDESGYDQIDLIKEQLKRAEEDEKVKAVVLKVDSPGGEVLAADEIYHLIEDFQKDDKDHAGKPVVCSMGSLAASGGYYIAAPCRYIIANELTLTGSIGVIMHGYNFRGLMDKFGVYPETYKSGKFKDMLSPDRSTNEIPAEERAMVQALIDETYQKFKGVVADGRKHAHDLNKKDGRALAPNWGDFADGRVLSGKQALDLGLVDELGDFDKAVDRAMDFAGFTEKETANVIEYQPRKDLSDLLRLVGRSNTRALKVDLGVDFPKLRAGYLYFLAPTYVH